MRFSDFPFLRYLPFLVAGVVCAQGAVPIPQSVIFLFIGIAWLAYLILIWRSNDFTRLSLPILAYVSLFSLGYFLAKNQSGLNDRSWDMRLDEADSYLARVSKHDIEKPNSFENQLEIIAFRDSRGWKKSKGEVLVYHKGKKPLLPGQVLWVANSPEEIPSPIFPDEFDYRGFLAGKNIHFRQFIGEKFKVIDSAEVDLPKYWITNFRKKLGSLIELKVPQPESQQIAAALLLGQKENLDKDIKNAYAETGTMHILAVSGLHVGIIYAILLFPLKGIRLKPNQRKMYLTGVILLIWTYAVLTGFSPSVIRAATMFSLFTAGQMRKRKPSSFNILAFSAILMITLNPAVIFEVGFQLSYAAVAGILLIQPLILRYWLPPNRVMEYCWQLTTVSIAAQLATFPLSVYYFHIFPSYFLLANLVVIPLSFIVMSVGIAFLSLSWVPGLVDLLGWAVGGLIWLQNWLTRAIQFFPGGNLDRLTITISGMILVWGICIVWANWEFGNRRKMVYLTLFLFSVWSGERLYREINRADQELLIFSGEKGILLDFTLGNRHFSWNESFPPEQISYAIDPNRIAEQRPQVIEPSLASENDSLVQFPVWDLAMNPTSKTFFWNKQKPKRIQEITQSTIREREVIDSLRVSIGAFRVVF
ncbi:ComEC/Rec2 family competence protein [Algoriphagus litoralis]|uniref:ComEC/Rec2 family competence protein n=1 Tax=Algoriphagus litoralis TaxID=2202829 RepID=UPI000DBAB8F5|nr:ComEC/Rec2 family competence protein [Algoriphagus litoralis]